MYGRLGSHGGTVGRWDLEEVRLSWRPSLHQQIDPLMMEYEKVGSVGEVDHWGMCS
jgi:hypothetical protein